MYFEINCEHFCVENIIIVHITVRSCWTEMAIGDSWSMEHGTCGSISLEMIYLFESIVIRPIECALWAPMPANWRPRMKVTKTTRTTKKNSVAVLLLSVRVSPHRNCIRFVCILSNDHFVLWISVKSVETINKTI